MAGIYNEVFDLLQTDDLNSYSSLAGDPHVIIEERTLRYWEPEDPDSEIDPMLKLFIRFSKYDTIVNEDAYYTRVEVFNIFGIDSLRNNEYVEFVESPDRIVLYQGELAMVSQKYAVVEYIDRKYSTRGVREGIAITGEKHLIYEDGLGCLPDIDFIEFVEEEEE